MQNFTKTSSLMKSVAKALFKVSLASVALIQFQSTAFGYGLGLSSFPFKESDQFMTTEFAGILSEGSGPGMQLRYAYRMNRALSFEGGLGFSDSERSNRFFIGSDFEMFPDYEKQPRIAAKVTLENANEFGDRKNIIGVAPLVSKGFSFWGKEAFPFITAPINIVLDSQTTKVGNEEIKRYEFRAALGLGITGKLPIQNYDHLLLNLEADFNLTKSFTAVYFGISYPISSNSSF